MFNETIENEGLRRLVDVWHGSVDYISLRLLHELRTPKGGFNGPFDTDKIVTRLS